MGVNAAGIGLTPHNAVMEQKCKWCRRRFTANKHAPNGTHLFHSAACQQAAYACRRKLRKLLDSRSHVQIAVIEPGRLADTLDEAARAGLQAVDTHKARRWSYEMALIHDALQRLQNGSYGLCDECGETMPDNRLAAVPWAARCIRCEEHA